ncbi:MAG: hypothetical protein H6621_13060 [Halobacteriovoraceae bacterium]|nr:hypothetical protein [Halobacteriovoraceae bacterium]
MKAHTHKFRNQFFISCSKGLEEELAREVQNVNPKNFLVTKGGIHFEAYPERAIELLLHSRIGSRIFKKYYEFEVKNEKDLYQFTKDIKWKSIFTIEQTFKIVVTQSPSSKNKKHSKFKNTLYLSQVIKDGIVDRFQRDCGKRPFVDVKNPDAIIHCHFSPNDNPYSQKEVVTISLDLTGAPLSNRGYRLPDAKAPLRENLAAGILDLLDWDGSENLIDPMCGTGSFLFEAYIKKNKTPTNLKANKWLRDNPEKIIWNFQKLPFFLKDKKLIENFQQTFQTALDKPEENQKSFILGFDNQAREVEKTQKNIAKLELSNDIEVKVGDATNLENPFSTPSLILCNPPYGQRISATSTDLEELYFQLGENAKKNFKGSRLAVISSEIELLKCISLRAERKWTLYNGPLKCQLVEYPLH